MVAVALLGGDFLVFCASRFLSRLVWRWRAVGRLVFLSVGQLVSWSVVFFEKWLFLVWNIERFRVFILVMTLKHLFYDFSEI